MKIHYILIFVSCLVTSRATELITLDSVAHIYENDVNRQRNHYTWSFEYDSNGRLKRESSFTFASDFKSLTKHREKRYIFHANGELEFYSNIIFDPGTEAISSQQTIMNYYEQSLLTKTVTSFWNKEKLKLEPSDSTLYYYNSDDRVDSAIVWTNGSEFKYAYSFNTNSQNNGYNSYEERFVYDSIDKQWKEKGFKVYESYDLEMRLLSHLQLSWTPPHPYVNIRSYYYNYDFIGRLTDYEYREKLRSMPDKGTQPYTKIEYFYNSGGKLDSVAEFSRVFKNEDIGMVYELYQSHKYVFDSDGNYLQHNFHKWWEYMNIYYPIFYFSNFFHDEIYNVIYSETRQIIEDEDKKYQKIRYEYNKDYKHDSIIVPSIDYFNDSYSRISQLVSQKYFNWDQDKNNYELDHTIKYIYSNSDTGISKKLNTQHLLSFYPNPTSNYIYFKTLEETSGKISIYNVEGELLIYQHIGAFAPINIQKLGIGTYYFVFECDGKKERGKFVVER